MPKYRVYGAVSGSTYLGEFEAPNKKEAVDIAISKSSLHLCHHCSHMVEDPEVISATAELVED